MLKDRVADLMAVPLLNQQETHNKGTVSYALKNSYKFGDFSGETNVQYSRFRWNYAKAFNPNSSQVTVLGVNDETLGVIGIQGMF
jgi:hypothetical protein